MGGGGGGEVKLHAIRKTGRGEEEGWIGHSWYKIDGRNKERKRKRRRGGDKYGREIWRENKTLETIKDKDIKSLQK